MAKRLFPYAGPLTTLGKISDRFNEEESSAKPNDVSKLDFTKLTEKQKADLKSALGLE